MPRAASDRDARSMVSTTSMPAARACPRRAHQAGHPPAGVAERFGRGEAEPPGGAQHQNLAFHAGCPCMKRS